MPLTNLSSPLTTVGAALPAMTVSLPPPTQRSSTEKLCLRRQAALWQVNHPLTLRSKTLLDRTPSDFSDAQCGRPDDYLVEVTAFCIGECS